MAMAQKADKQTAEVWDVIVIGGGPAGMMAAGRAAERGAKVLLLEKNDSLGKKLLITGGGRCNVTNAEFDNRVLLKKFKDNDKYLFSAFSKWSVKETLEFFHLKNMDTKVEALQRVFPVSNKAQSVWDVLVAYMKEGNVTVRSKCPVTGFEFELGETGTNDKKDNNGGKIIAVKLKGAERLRARQFILATGGKSHPETGSTGEGFEWLKEIGHTVIEQAASLVPVEIENAWVKRLQGVTLQNVKLSLYQNNVKQASGSGSSNGTKAGSSSAKNLRKNASIGRILFTHFGVSGPTVLNMSHDIGELLKYGTVILSIDLLPEFDYAKLNLKLQEVLREHNNKLFKNSLGTLVSPAIAPIIVELSGINPETFSHSITREQRLALVQLLKAIPLRVQGLLGVDKAIITSGGVTLDEVDFKTMSSRIFPNLFLVGDILNIDRPSGGYGLQLCWTTGFVAGDSAASAN